MTVHKRESGWEEETSTELRLEKYVKCILERISMRVIGGMGWPNGQNRKQSNQNIIVILSIQAVMGETIRA